MKELHTFNLTCAIQWTCINGAHAAVGHELRDFGLGGCVVAGDKDIEWLTSYLSRKKRACECRVESLDDFRVRQVRLQELGGRGRLMSSSGIWPSRCG